MFDAFAGVVTKGARVLDLGSGAGAWALRLKENEYDVTACDVSSKTCMVPCVEANLNEQFSSKFGSSQFDAITCLEVLEHVENPRHVLRESRKLLKDGGKFILSTPNASGLYSRLKFFFTGRFTMFDDRDYHGSGHIRPLTYWEIGKILDENGFRIERTLFYDVTPILPRTAGDAIKRLSWIFRPFMKGIVGTMITVVIAEKH